ncbi:hypothetical protein Tco_0735728 [Tanacetum coccineum]
MAPLNNLGPHVARKSVNETLYKGMVGAMMYLTASQRDIQFSICLCVRYHANPKESQMITVKRIFRYLEGCNMDRKSTFGAYQLLEGKLVCWSVKNQQSMAMSFAEAPTPITIPDVTNPIPEYVITDPPVDESSLTTPKSQNTKARRLLRTHDEVSSVLEIEYKAKQEMITRSKIYRVSLDEVKEAEKPVKSRKEFVNLQAQALLVNSEKLKGKFVNKKKVFDEM